VVNDRKKQNAGDNSQQLQANTINITNVNGIDEKRAREIFSEMYDVARREFSQDAYECANQRVAMFEESLMPKIVQIDGALEKFADPSFQFLLKEAHKTAASTEREADYDLLSELLIHRIKKGELRKTRAGIERAVEIVDKIDDDALCALTVSHTLAELLPVTGKIVEGLDTLQNIFDKLEYLALPQGTDWLEHLEILNAVRINAFGGLKKAEQFYVERLDGYVCVGIRKHSENYDKALEILNNIKLPPFFLVDHELLNDFVRLPISTLDAVDTICFTAERKIGELVIKNKITLSDEQKQGLRHILELYDRSDDMKKQVVDAFVCEWKKRDSLRILLEWWDNIPISFNITAVGTVLAHANAQRCDPDIPPLE
jgi:hypothetical protein